LLGDASYSIYLSHVFVIGAVKQVTLRLVTISDSPLQVCIFIGACMVLSALAGVCIYLWFEVPVLAWLRKTLLAPVPRPMLEQG
jgi:exopolysaccharide production protein ExoZ